MPEGKIKNVGDFSSPFNTAKTPSQSGSDSIMGMRGSDATGITKPIVQVHTPPSTGGGANVQNVGQLDPGAKPIK